jgi:NAD-dependent SIR2 family protein deacetylase
MKVNVMSEPAISKLTSLLLNAQHIAVLTGAGMSTESGIPDFRSAGGLWTQNMSLVDVVNIEYFRADPVAFWKAFKSIFSIKLVGNYQPNQGHLFLAWLESIGKQVSVLTQNIDGLHQRAGSNKVVELHGSLMTASCPVCRKVHDLAYIKENNPPLCVECGLVLKPNVILYGEAVPHIEEAFLCARDADCLLVMGSSLEVSPVNYIPQISAQNDKPCVLINLSPTPLDDLFDDVIQAGIGTTCQRLQTAMKQVLKIA